jgi:hypothetical protein
LSGLAGSRLGELTTVPDSVMIIDTGLIGNGDFLLGCVFSGRGPPPGLTARLYMNDIGGLVLPLPGVSHFH